MYIPFFYTLFISSCKRCKLESETDASSDGVVTDILNVLGEIHGAFMGDELAVRL